MPAHRFVPTLLLAALPAALPSSSWRFQNGVVLPSEAVRTVVIDAGHGGVDSGCKGNLAYEKNVSLSISLKVGELIKAEYPDVRIINIRNQDMFFGLQDRAMLANREKADLFLSIHCNSFTTTEAYGTETYVLGLHVSEENLAVAKRENNAITYEKGYEKRYANVDPETPEGHIYYSMLQNAHLDQSIDLATKIDNQLKSYAGRPSRGVKQAGFLVLREVTMPSVLVEVGFLTNPTEERFLVTADGQQKIATAIFRAFRDYKDGIEGVVLGLNSARKITEPLPKLPAGVKKEVAPSADAPAPKSPDSPEQAPPKQSTNPAAQAPLSASKPSPSAHGIEFMVQLGAGEQVINPKSKPWSAVANLKTYSDGKIYRYFAGGYASYANAVEGQIHWRRNGFQDAFVVAYQNGKRIELKTAKTLTGQ